MDYKGIVITGTRAAGKSTVCKKLLMKYSCFKKVQAVTTRTKRTDDELGEYQYMDVNKYNNLKSTGKLIIEVEYNGYYYGITDDAYKKVLTANQIPVLIIAPEAVNTLIITKKELIDSMLSFFIDEEDSELNNRLINRDNIQITEGVLKQRLFDRKYKSLCTYNIKNSDSDKTMELINILWNYKNTGGVLPKHIIKLMIECGLLLNNANIDNIHSASYDLVLGDEYYYGGEIKTLSEKRPFMEIEPYDYVIASCKETANMPSDTIGRFDVAVKLFCQGIILSNGPQIDPGFRGKLFCLLFNTSNKSVFLKRGDHYATIEFHKLLEPTEPYKGQYQDKDKIVNYIPSNALNGAINELKKEIENLKKESKNNQNIFLGVISLILATLSIMLVFK